MDELTFRPSAKLNEGGLSTCPSVESINKRTHNIKRQEQHLIAPLAILIAKKVTVTHNVDDVCVWIRLSLFWSLFSLPLLNVLFFSLSGLQISLWIHFY